MIINIRGTSGSGKSTLVREILRELDFVQIVSKHGRKQPLGYIYREPKPCGFKLFVPGHYETPCGGCDTIQTMDAVFNLVNEYDEKGMHVLFEGLLISSELKRTVALWERMCENGRGDEFLVIQLDVPIEVCLDSVNKRRKAKNPDKGDVNPKNTISKHKGVSNTMAKLENLGIHVARLGRTEAYKLARKELFRG